MLDHEQVDKEADTERTTVTPSDSKKVAAASKSKKKKKKAAKPAEVTESKAQNELINRIAELCALEHTCRERYRSISGYTRERSTSENVSLGDLMLELSAVEEKVRLMSETASNQSLIAKTCAGR